MSGWREIVGEALRDEAEPVDAAPPASEPLTDGLAALQAMRMPAIATPDRWQQVQADAAALITDCGDVLRQLGWTVADVFGLDLAAREGDLGLIYTILGGRVVLVDGKCAMIRAADGRTTRIHYRRDDPPEPIWELRP